MIIFRIHISSWTASFRYSNMISAYQPTLMVPPFSTICGLISAAKGEYFKPDNEKIGFVFNYESKYTDLETVYQMGQSLTGIKSNVLSREILYNVNLYLYSDNSKIAEYFSSPFYPLLLGRSSDLASVNSIIELQCESKKELSIIGTIFPFNGELMPGMLQALPVLFSDTFPRNNVITKPYYIFDMHNKSKNKVKADGFRDEEFNWDVCWQEIDIE